MYEILQQKKQGFFFNECMYEIQYSNPFASIISCGGICSDDGEGGQNRKAVFADLFGL